MSDLKPCPFCGSRDVAQGASRERISVWCGCGAQGPAVAFPENCIDPVTPIKECHERWNRRAALPQEPAPEPVAWTWIDAAPQAQARVKGLRWPPECPRGQRVHGRGAPFDGVEYCIAHYGGSHGDDTVYWWAAPKGKWSEPFDNYGAAKAAAQADYERRIRSALDEQGPATPADERVVEALNHPYEDWRAALDFAIDEGIEAETFLRVWREGDWKTLDDEWPEWGEKIAALAREAGRG